MAIKITGDEFQHGTTAIATLSANALTMEDDKAFVASEITASAGLCVTGSVRFLSNGTDNAQGPEEIEFTTDEVKVTGSLTVTGDFTVLGTQSLGDTETDSLSVAGTATITNDLNVQGGTALSGALDVVGATTLDGAVTLGNATGDDLTFTGRVASHVLPKTDAAYDLGSTALGYNDLHLGSGGVINLDGGDVTLTHAAGKLTWGGDGSVEIDFNNHEMTNVDIDSGAIDGAVIGAASAANGTFTTLTCATLKAATLQAADATAAGSIANSTGVVTLASSVLTTTDINGGSIDGANIGAASAGTGAFTTLAASSTLVVTSTTTLNDAATVNAVLDITDATDASNATGDTGALRCEGGASIAKKLYVGTDLDVDGIANLDAVDIDGAVQVDNTITVGADDQGYDVKFFGDTASAYMLWDTSADDLILAGAAGLVVPDGKLTLNATAVTATGAELNYVDIASLGTAAASKALVADGSAEIDAGAITFTDLGTVSTADINGGSIDGVVIGATSALAGTFTDLTVSGKMSGSNGFRVSDGGAMAVMSLNDTDGFDLTVSSATISSNAAITGTLNVTGDVTLNGALVPDSMANGVATKDLGSSTNQWKDLYVDGVAYLDEVDIDAGAIDGTNIGASSAGTGAFTTLATAGIATLVGAVNVNGDLTLESDHDAKARSFITYSDATLKQDIKPLDSALDKVMSMRGVSYEFKNQASAEGATHREVGFLAQEMKQSVPEVVYGNGDGNLGIDYAKLTSVLVEAVKAQQSQIEELRAALLKK
jgi:hypothetical protein